MKTKLLFILMLLVSWNATLASQNTDSLIDKAVWTFAQHWDNTPGNNGNKLRAILTWKPVQIQDSIAMVCDRELGFFVIKERYYHRCIFYDEINNQFKETVDPHYRQGGIPRNVLVVTIILTIVVMYGFLLLTYVLAWQPSILSWIFWILNATIVVFLNCYLGTTFVIGSLIYIFKYKIKYFVKGLFPKKKKDNIKRNG